MKTIPIALQTHLNGEVTALCTCWKVTRVDTQIFAFTDHDQDLIIDGVTYQAESGFIRSAITNSATAAPGTMEVDGFLDTDVLTDHDLRAGRFDFAAVELFMVNWQDTSSGRINLRKGHFGEATITSSGQFRIELRGLGQQLSQTVGRTYLGPCDADLGDSRCTVQIATPERMPNTAYALGARTIVYDTSADKVSSIVIPNASFGNSNDLNAIDTWVGTNANVVPHNVAVNDPLDVWGFLPLDWTGSILLNQLLWTTGAEIQASNGTVTPFNTVTINNNSKTAAYDGYSIVTSFMAQSPNPYLKFEVYVEWFDQSGTPTGTQTLAVNPSLTIPPNGNVGYDYKSYQFTVIAKPPPGPDTVANLDAHPLSDFASWKFRWSIRWSKNTAYVPTATMAFDYTLVPIITQSYAKLNAPSTNIVNPWNYKMDLAAASNTIVSDWNRSGLSYVYSQRFGVTAKDPSGKFLAWSDIGGAASLWTDPIALVGLAGLTTGDIDTNLYVVDFDYFQTAYGLLSMLRAYPVFYSTNSSTDPNANIVSPTGGQQVPDYYKTQTLFNWEYRKATYNVPSGARYIRFLIGTQKDPSQSISVFSSLDSCIDELSAIIRPITNLPKNFVNTGGVEYAVTTAGTTNNSVASGYSRTLSNTVTDGSVIWTVVSPQFVLLGTVAHVDSNSNFTITGADAFPDGFFERGQVRFLTGIAAGTNREVFSHTGTAIILRQLSPFKPAIGDRVLMVVGCDKKISTCKAKFSNHLNFRGFPRIPGTNQYFKVGTPRA